MTRAADEPRPAFSMDRRPSAERRVRGARIALAHDWLVSLRGGERVLDRIARLVLEDHKPAGLYTLTDARRPMTESIDAFEHVRSSLDRLPLARRRLRRWLLPWYPRGVESLRVKLARAHEHEPIDLLLSTHSTAIKALSPPAGVPHLCYCHTPARFLWSQAEEYTRGRGPAARLRRAGLNRHADRLREWDVQTVRAVDTFLANSRHTRDLIQRVYKREARVVYPPVRTAFFTPTSEERQDYWLLVGALEPYKRTDLAIDAAIQSNARLLVAGDGSQAKALRAHAKRVERQVRKSRGKAGRVEFLGRVDDEQLRALYRRARLLVFPQVEDFGIVPLEAQACGTPVVARREGGALETVLEGRTGVFFDDPSPAALADAARRCPDHVAENCRANAERFSETVFDEKMRAEIARMLR